MNGFLFKKLFSKTENKKSVLFEITKDPEKYILLAGIKDGEINIKIRKRNDKDII